MDISLWLAFAAASTALLLVPGPTVLLVLAYAIGQGSRVAVPTAFGVALGDLIAMSASLLGLGALVLASATLFGLLKWIGALYLIWLGVGMIRRAGDIAPDFEASPKRITPRQAFASAAMVTALNPKSIVFFIAFVPQFLNPEAPLFAQSAILVATFVGLGTINALAYAVLAARMTRTIRRPGVIRWFARLGGAALVAMGVLTAGLRRAAS